MTSLMMPAATMTTMTNTAPIAVTQPGVGKPDPAKIGFMNNNRQGKTKIPFQKLQLTHLGQMWVIQLNNNFNNLRLMFLSSYTRLVTILDLGYSCTSLGCICFFFAKNPLPVYFRCNSQCNLTHAHNFQKDKIYCGGGRKK